MIANQIYNLSYVNLSWDEVEKGEFGGYLAYQAAGFRGLYWIP